MGENAGAKKSIFKFGWQHSKIKQNNSRHVLIILNHNNVSFYTNPGWKINHKFFSIKTTQLWWLEFFESFADDVPLPSFCFPLAAISAGVCWHTVALVVDDGGGTVGVFILSKYSCRDKASTWLIMSSSSSAHWDMPFEIIWCFKTKNGFFMSVFQNWPYKEGVKSLDNCLTSRSRLFIRCEGPAASETSLWPNNMLIQLS